MTSNVILGLSGSLHRPSRTRALVETAVSRAARLTRAQSAVIDLLDLGPELGTARRLSDLSAVARGTVDAIIAADALVVASPVYKGSYTGLFKHLIDLIDPLALVGKPVLLAATGGGDRHALVIEHQLRPLFAFFEAATLATGIYASEKEIDYDGTVSPGLSDRLDRAVAQFGPHLGARATEPRNQRTLPPARSIEPIAAAAAASA